MHTFATWNNLKKITMKDMMNKRIINLLLLLALAERCR